jgi:protein YibB
MFTVVTAFYDLGRSEWHAHDRKLDLYMKFFINMLSLRVPMVIFVSPESVDVVDIINSKRRFIDKKTTIIFKSFENLYMYKHFDRIQEIQKDPFYAEGHPNKDAPEICQPYYNVMVCNKMAFVLEATKYDIDSDYFMWMDAGYTHSTIDLSKLDFDPTRFTNIKNKMYMMSIVQVDAAKKDPKEFFLQYADIILGGFFGGTRDIIEKITPLYYDVVQELMDINIKDDDQYYNTIMVQRYPDLFEILVTWGKWYEAVNPEVFKDD